LSQHNTPRAILKPIGNSHVCLAARWACDIRAHLIDGTIFPYNCCMRLAQVMSATRIVSSKSDAQYLHDSCTQHENDELFTIFHASRARYKSCIRQSQAKIGPNRPLEVKYPALIGACQLTGKLRVKGQPCKVKFSRCVFPVLTG